MTQVRHLILNLRVPHRRWFCEGGAVHLYWLHVSDRIGASDFSATKLQGWRAGTGAIAFGAKSSALHGSAEGARAAKRE